MIITVFGATGQVGRRIVNYALAKGHTVRAFGRNVSDLIDEDLANKNLEAIKGSVFDDNDLLYAIKGADGILSALGGDFSGNDKTRSLGMKKIVAQMEKTGVRKIVAVGGLGILSDDAGRFLMDSPDYPKQFIPVGNEHLQAYFALQHSILDWTFVCSPEIKDVSGEGRYVVNDNHLPEPNKFYISSGDLAHFMVNELESPKHTKKRVGISATS